MALHARIQADILPARWNVKPFGLNLCVAKPRHTRGIPPVRRLDLTKNLSTSLAEHFLHGLLSAIFETDGRVSLGLAYNRAQVEDDPEVRAAGIRWDLP